MQKTSHIYANLKKLCDDRGISISQMHKDCGLGCSTAYRWQDGKVTPNAATAEKIATYFGLTIDDIMLRTQPQTGNTPVAESNNPQPNNTNADLISIIKSQHEALQEQLRIQNKKNDDLMEIIKTLTTNDKFEPNRQIQSQKKGRAMELAASHNI